MDDTAIVSGISGKLEIVIYFDICQYHKNPQERETIIIHEMSNCLRQLGEPNCSRGIRMSVYLWKNATQKYFQVLSMHTQKGKKKKRNKKVILFATVYLSNHLQYSIWAFIKNSIPGSDTHIWLSQTSYTYCYKKKQVH